MKKIVAGTFSLMLILFTGLNVAFASHGADSNDRDCEGGENPFTSAEEVMEHWNSHGYSAENDPERLDGDSDGLPCEDNFPDVVNYSDDEAGSGEEEPAAEEPETTENDEESTEDGEVTEANEEADEDEGGALPDTATNNPLMAVVGLAMAGTGALFLARRRRLE